MLESRSDSSSLLDPANVPSPKMLNALQRHLKHVLVRHARSRAGSGVYSINVPEAKYVSDRLQYFGLDESVLLSNIGLFKLPQIGCIPNSVVRQLVDISRRSSLQKNQPALKHYPSGKGKWKLHPCQSPCRPPGRSPSVLSELASPTASLADMFGSTNARHGSSRRASRRDSALEETRDEIDLWPSSEDVSCLVKPSLPDTMHMPAIYSSPYIHLFDILSCSDFDKHAAVQIQLLSTDSIQVKAMSTLLYDVSQENWFFASRRPSIGSSGFETIKALYGLLQRTLSLNIFSHVCEYLVDFYFSYLEFEDIDVINEHFQPIREELMKVLSGEMNPSFKVNACRCLRFIGSDDEVIINTLTKALLTDESLEVRLTAEVSLYVINNSLVYLMHDKIKTYVEQQSYDSKDTEKKKVMLGIPEQMAIRTKRYSEIFGDKLDPSLVQKTQEVQINAHGKRILRMLCRESWWQGSADESLICVLLRLAALLTFPETSNHHSICFFILECHKVVHDQLSDTENEEFLSLLCKCLSHPQQRVKQCVIQTLECMNYTPLSALQLVTRYEKRRKSQIETEEIDLLDSLLRLFESKENDAIEKEVLLAEKKNDLIICLRNEEWFLDDITTIDYLNIDELFDQLLQQIQPDQNEHICVNACRYIRDLLYIATPDQKQNFPLDALQSALQNVFEHGTKQNAKAALALLNELSVSNITFIPILLRTLVSNTSFEIRRYAWQELCKRLGVSNVIELRHAVLEYKFSSKQLALAMHDIVYRIDERMIHRDSKAVRDMLVSNLANRERCSVFKAITIEELEWKSKQDEYITLIETLQKQSWWTGDESVNDPSSVLERIGDIVIFEQKSKDLVIACRFMKNVLNVMHGIEDETFVDTVNAIKDKFETYPAKRTKSRLKTGAILEAKKSIVQVSSKHTLPIITQKSGKSETIKRSKHKLLVRKDNYHIKMPSIIIKDTDQTEKEKLSGEFVTKKRESPSAVKFYRTKSKKLVALTKSSGTIAKGKKQVLGKVASGHYFRDNYETKKAKSTPDLDVPNWALGLGAQPPDQTSIQLPKISGVGVTPQSQLLLTKDEKKYNSDELVATDMPTNLRATVMKQSPEDEAGYDVYQDVKKLQIYTEKENLASEFLAVAPVVTDVAVSPTPSALLDASPRSSAVVDSSLKPSAVLDASPRPSALLDASPGSSSVVDSSLRPSAVLVSSPRRSVVVDSGRRPSTAESKEMQLTVDNRKVSHVSKIHKADLYHQPTRLTSEELNVNDVIECASGKNTVEMSPAMLTSQYQLRSEDNTGKPEAIHIAGQEYKDKLAKKPRVSIQHSGTFIITHYPSPCKDYGQLKKLSSFVPVGVRSETPFRIKHTPATASPNLKVVGKRASSLYEAHKQRFTYNEGTKDSINQRYIDGTFSPPSLFTHDNLKYLNDENVRGFLAQLNKCMYQDLRAVCEHPEDVGKYADFQYYLPHYSSVEVYWRKFSALM